MLGAGFFTHSFTSKEKFVVIEQKHFQYGDGQKNTLAHIPTRPVVFIILE